MSEMLPGRLRASRLRATNELAFVKSLQLLQLLITDVLRSQHPMFLFIVPSSFIRRHCTRKLSRVNFQSKSPRALAGNENEFLPSGPSEEVEDFGTLEFNEVLDEEVRTGCLPLEYLLEPVF